MTVSISNIPGRIRLENTYLIGRKRDCERLEEAITSMDGVQSAKVNSRTGRILICYQYSPSLEKDLHGLLNWRTDLQATASDFALSLSSKARDLFVDLAIHIAVPSPFDMLVPIALKSLR